MCFWFVKDRYVNSIDHYCIIIFKFFRIVNLLSKLILDAPGTSNDASLPDVNGQLVFNPFTSIGWPTVLFYLY